MNLQLCWLKQFKNAAFKLAKVNSHVLFLEACYNLGLTPLGLTVKPPLSGTPQFMWPELINLFRTTSLNATKTVLDNYKTEQTKLINSLHSNCQLLLSTAPNFIEEIVMTIRKANELQEKLAGVKLKKLSKLCLQKIKDSGYIEAYQKPQIKNVPLIGDKPSLASLFNLPTPIGQLPYLPKTTNQTREKTNPKENPSASSTKNTIMNISNHNLTNEENRILSKGLTFTPTQKPDLFSLGKDVFSFARNLRIQYYIYENPEAFKNISKPEECLMKFKPPSNWDPPPLHPDHPIELYINYIMQSITDQNFKKNLPSSDNLTKREREALQSLKKNKNIMILPADKGSTTVIMNTEDYKQEAYRQLSDETIYKPMNENPTNKFNQELNQWLQQETPRQNISIETLNLLINNEPTTPQFYILPKIHKNILPPPGRPIVASCNSITERISAYLDSHLQPLVNQLPSHIKDTNHFLDRLKSVSTPLPIDAILVTVDVTSLYTNIPHTHGLAALEYFLDQRPRNSLPSTSFLINLAKFILEKNNFQFEGKNYIQIKGTAMGTRMAPSYANLYMGRFEQAFLRKQETQPKCWFRFIDDIFLIWTSGIESLNKFLDNLQNFSILQFTNNISSSEATFLDVNLKLNNGQITTGIHIKPTNHLQYLHFDSCHPTNTKRSIPYSQALRAKRICSTEDELKKFNSKISKSLIERGYPKNLVQNQIRLAQSNDDTPKKKSKSSYQINLVTDYHHGLQTLNSFLINGFKILQASPHTKDFIKTPPTVTFRQPPNIKQILVHPKIPAPNTTTTDKPPNGSYPCNTTRCKTCPINLPSTTFSSNSTNEKFKIQGHNTCSSSNVIYQLQCKDCPAQYIGLTKNQFRTRMNGHRQDVKTNYKDKPVVQHASKHNKSDFNQCFSSKIIKKLPQNCNPSQLRRWELSYQWFTSSRNPPNLNIR